MVQAPQRNTLRGPTFIRLLARLTDVDVPQSGLSLSDRLSQWLDWKQSLALSTALDGRPATDGFDAPRTREDEDECTRLRESLAQAIGTDPLLAGAGEEAAGVVDYAPLRQRYITLQRRMQSATGHLRGRLRDLLARQSADGARLAELDAVMELALSPREHMLMAGIPALLGEHFERLQETSRAAQPDVADAEHAMPNAPAAWLDQFRKDMQSVLLAELDVRFQPVEGLLAALRPR